MGYRPFQNFPSFQSPLWCVDNQLPLHPTLPGNATLKLLALTRSGPQEIQKCPRTLAIIFSFSIVFSLSLMALLMCG